MATLFYITLLLVLRMCTGEYVYTLNTTNFMEHVSKGNWLVDFYAPWCGHCKKLAPVWEATAEELHEDGIPVLLGKVDCTSEGAVCNNVNGYPTIKWFKEGKEMRDYSGPRLQENLVAHCKRISGPSTERLEGSDPFRRIEELRRKGAVILGVGKVPEDYERVALKHLEVPFLVLPEEAPAKYGLKSGDVAVFNDVNGDKPYVYNGDDLDGWVSDNKLDVFPALMNDNYHTLLESGRPLVIGFVGKDDQSKRLKSSLRQAAIRDREVDGRKFVVCTMDVNGRGHKRFLEELGVTSHPTMVVLTLKQELVYPYTGTSFTPADVDQFLRDFTAGNLSSRGMEGIAGFLRRNLWFVVGGLVALLIAVIAAAWYFIEDELEAPAPSRPATERPPAIEPSAPAPETKKDK